MNTANPLALDIKNVSHNYGQRQALSNVGLTIGQGEFCGLLGLNGAGKTTLFSLITRLFDNTSGHVMVMGHDVRRFPKQAMEQLGVVFQNRTLDPELSVLQNMTYHASLHGLPRRFAREKAMQELDRVSLSDRAHEKVRSLSGGQMRRIEIARALLHQPNLLLLDEPTVGLDVGARRDITSHVRRLVDEDGLAVLWATHLMDEIAEDDRVVVLHEGKVLASGLCRDLVAENGADDLKAAFNSLAGLNRNPAEDEAA
ncbi:MAG: ATP-binding cassette domain-containing protein [Hyphomicrobiales bacterium]|nr:ATP-binding cassette domain-containing protein [Hyphomicrobiales bacterium]